MTQSARDKTGTLSDSPQRGATKLAEPPATETKPAHSVSRPDTGKHQTGGSQRLSPEVQALLGSKLRTLYTKLIEEPIPAPLLDLLRRLEDQQNPDTEAEETAP